MWKNFAIGGLVLAVIVEAVLVFALASSLKDANAINLGEALKQIGKCKDFELNPELKK